MSQNRSLQNKKRGQVLQGKMGSVWKPRIYTKSNEKILKVLRSMLTFKSITLTTVWGKRKTKMLFGNCCDREKS